MTEPRGHWDPRPRHPNRPPTGPEPLRDLLRQFLEDRDWHELGLPAASTNGHGPHRPTTARHDHG